MSKNKHSNPVLVQSDDTETPEATPTTTCNFNVSARDMNDDELLPELLGRVAFLRDTLEMVKEGAEIVAQQGRIVALDPCLQALARAVNALYEDNDTRRTDPNTNRTIGRIFEPWIFGFTANRVDRQNRSNDVMLRLHPETIADNQKLDAIRHRIEVIESDLDLVVSAAQQWKERGYTSKLAKPIGGLGYILKLFHSPLTDPEQHWFFNWQAQIPSQTQAS